MDSNAHDREHASERAPGSDESATPGAEEKAAGQGARDAGRLARVAQVGAGIGAGVGAGVGAAAAAAGVAGAAAGDAAARVGRVGDYLKEQRLASRLSLRQLADRAGVSNPYLSQIERGLRKPSAEVLNQLAKALHISSEQLYVHAGLISSDSPAAEATSVEAAIAADARLTARQRQTLLEIHASFVAVNGAGPGELDGPGETR